jgi:acetylornithine deacetylase
LVGTIAGGVQTSIVPPSCELTLDRRIIPGQDVAAALADIDALLQRLEMERPGIAAEREAFLAIPPVEVASDVPVCRELERAVAEVTGQAATATGLRATSDAATFLAAGIPAVVFGPGSLREAHRADESVPLDEVRAASRILALAIVRLLA